MKIKMKEKPWVLVLFAIIVSVGIWVVVENERHEQWLRDKEAFWDQTPNTLMAIAQT